MTHLYKHHPCRCFHQWIIQFEIIATKAQTGAAKCTENILLLNLIIMNDVLMFCCDVCRDFLQSEQKHSEVKATRERFSWRFNERFRICALNNFPSENHFNTSRQPCHGYIHARQVLPSVQQPMWHKWRGFNIRSTNLYVNCLRNIRKPGKFTFSMF